MIHFEVSKLEAEHRTKSEESKNEPKTSKLTSCEANLKLQNKMHIASAANFKSQPTLSNPRSVKIALRGEEKRERKIEKKQERKEKNGKMELLLDETRRIWRVRV